MPLGLFTRTPYPKDYYQVHRCKKCADTPEPTPLEFAQQTLHTRLSDMAPLMAREQFSLGWEVGIEGNYGLNPMPVEVVADTEAYLLGLTTGAYASKYGYGTPHCFDPDQRGHID